MLISSGVRILVVDDDKDVRTAIRVLLESAGYASVTEVNSGAIALKFVSDVVPELVILDVRMPEMDGIQVLKEIKFSRHTTRVPVIIITGHGDVSLAVGAMKAGAADFIEKPFGAQALLASVHSALDTVQPEDIEAAKTAADRLIGLLTPRERKVLDQIMLGRSSKVIAYELSLSPHTVEIHRAHIMKKFEARSLSDVVGHVMRSSCARTGRWL